MPSYISHPFSSHSHFQPHLHHVHWKQVLVHTYMTGYTVTAFGHLNYRNIRGVAGKTQPSWSISHVLRKAYDGVEMRPKATARVDSAVKSEMAATRQFATSSHHAFPKAVKLMSNCIGNKNVGKVFHPGWDHTNSYGRVISRDDLPWYENASMASYEIDACSHLRLSFSTKPFF